jgi:DNA-directed RNA polymerase specialized sigma24 family protein
MDSPSTPLPCHEQEPLTGSVTHLFSLARQGDAAAFAPLWQHFFPRLVSLARKRFSGRPAVSDDAEDAAQAALISFWSQLQSGELLQDLCREGLWNLLATITARKVGKQKRHDAAARRGAGRVQGEADLPGDRPLAELLSVLPTQELDLQAAELMEALPPELQELAMLRLLGHSTEEIAEQFDCTRRKVQRKLELVRLRWESLTAVGRDVV